MINFFTEVVDFDREDFKFLKSWLGDIVDEYSYSEESINYIFCNDEYLLDINKRYLKNDYYTDIITFPYIEGKKLSADIYISIERVEYNAKALNYEFEEEFLRILVHGMLHMLGYNDKTDEEVNKIRREEDRLIDLYREKYV